MGVIINLNSLNSGEGWKKLKEQYKQEYNEWFKPYYITISEDDKIYSFFKYSIVSKSLSNKFDKVWLLRNNKEDFEEHGIMSFGYEGLSEHNLMVIEIIVTGFILFYFALYYLFDFLEDYQEDEIRNPLNTELFDFSIFYKFQNMFFLEFFLCDDNLQDVSKSYIFDFDFYNTYINYYNFNLFFSLKWFEVLFNLDKFVYEEYLILYGEEKAEKKKMYIDYFDFDSLDYQNDLYFAFCIYEFFNSFTYLNFIFHDFNNDYFGKLLVFDDIKLDDTAKYDPKFFRYKTFLNKKNNKKFLNKSLHTYYLTSTYFSFCLEFLKKRKKKNRIITSKTNTYLYKLLYINYKKLISLNNDNNNENNENKFNLRNFILDYKNYSLKMPGVIFLLYSWYCIYYRQLRYNQYIGAHPFFIEYFSRMSYFIRLNNTRSQNLWKFAPLKFQKLNTVYHFKSYVEMKLFNDQLFFYFGLKSFILKYINNDSIVQKENMKILLNNEHIKHFIKIKNNIIFEEDNNMSLFFNEYLIQNAYNYEMILAYTLFMNSAVTKFTKTFCLGKLGFLEYEEMLETVFFLPHDRRILNNYIENNMIYQYYFDIYNDSILNKFFIKDFFNFKNIKEICKYKKILTFFNKLIYLVFFLLDPFFFKYFWKRCFPKKWNKLWKIYRFVWTNIFMVKFYFGVENYGVLEFDIQKYNYLMFFLNWRIDTSSSVGMNYFNNDIVGMNFIISNLIYKNRFYELIKQIHLLMKYYKIKNSQKRLYYFYLVNLKSFYFDVLYNNIDYGFLLFFYSLQKFKNFTFLYNFNGIKDFIYYNFIYRYYVSVILFQNHYYDDWFHDWKKRILMTYVDNFHKHEGKYFYSIKHDII